MNGPDRVGSWRVMLPAAIVVIVWVAAAWFPTSRSLDELDHRSDAATAERLALVADVDEANRLEAEQAETAERGQRLESALPDSARIDQFVRSVDRITIDHDVAVSRLSPLALETSSNQRIGAALPPGVTAVSMTLGASGTYPNLMNFLESLTALDRVVVVDSLALASKADATGVLDLELGFRVFTTGNLVGVTTDSTPKATSATADEEDS